MVHRRSYNTSPADEGAFQLVKAHTGAWALRGAICWRLSRVPTSISSPTRSSEAWGLMHRLGKSIVLQFSPIFFKI